MHVRYKVAYASLGRFIVGLLEFGDCIRVEVDQPFCIVSAKFADKDTFNFFNSTNLRSMQAFLFDIEGGKL